MSPGLVDAQVIARHLSALDVAVAQLRRHAGKPASALSDLEEVWIIERGLQICAQNALDVATHLSVTSGRDAPDYASAIDGLVQLGILPADFAARFRGIAGFRNLLVHGYLEVDLARLHQLLNTRLDDFVEFAGYVQAHLAKTA